MALGQEVSTSNYVFGLNINIDLKSESDYPTKIKLRKLLKCMSRTEKIYFRGRIINYI